MASRPNPPVDWELAERVAIRIADRAPFAPPADIAPREEEDADVADWDSESWSSPPWC